MTFDIRELATEDEIRALEPLMLEYTRFVSGEIFRLFDINIPPEGEVARTLAQIDQILPPKGRSFAVYVEGVPEGMVFIRPVSGAIFEIKRLYVRPALRGSGAGRALATRGIDAARELGAKCMVLDSTKNLTDAARLYQSLGFVYSEPYAASDHGQSSLAQHMIFMEKALV